MSNYYVDTKLVGGPLDGNVWPTSRKWGSMEFIGDGKPIQVHVYKLDDDTRETASFVRTEAL